MVFSEEGIQRGARLQTTHRSTAIQQQLELPSRDALAPLVLLRGGRNGLLPEVAIRLGGGHHSRPNNPSLPSVSSILALESSSAGEAKLWVQ